MFVHLLLKDPHPPKKKKKMVTLLNLFFHFEFQLRNTITISNIFPKGFLFLVFSLKQIYL